MTEAGAHNEKKNVREERDTTTHLIKIQVFNHASRVTKFSKHACYVRVKQIMESISASLEFENREGCRLPLLEKLLRFRGPKKVKRLFVPSVGTSPQRSPPDYWLSEERLFFLITEQPRGVHRCFGTLQQSHKRPRRQSS